MTQYEWMTELGHEHVARFDNENGTVTDVYIDRYGQETELVSPS